MIKVKEVDDNKISIFIDVDDTLTHNCGETFIPGSIETIKELSNKANIFIWSQGGFKYVQDIVEKTALNKFICGMLPKPDIVIDDIPIKTRWIRKHLWPVWSMIKEWSISLEGNFADDFDV
jgi:hypothetical protein